MIGIKAMSTQADQPQGLSFQKTYLSSMTGFGRAQVQVDSTTYLVEIKSVNSRFLDINFRGSTLGAALEHHIRQALQKHFKRGKFDVFSGSIKGVGNNSVVDEGLFRRVIESGRALLRAEGLDSGSNLDAVSKIALERAFSGINQSANGAPSLGLGGLFEEGSDGFKQLLSAVDAACTEVGEMRRREGEKLRIKLEEYCLGLLDLVDKISKRSNTIANELLERGRQRVAALISSLRPAQANENDLRSALDLGDLSTSDLSDARLLQELAIIADKADISEELVRLSSHLKSIHDMLSSSQEVDPAGASGGVTAGGSFVIERPNSIGKRIEFILQETQREINTLSVKCQNLEVVNWCVQGKLLCEQMKEQIQNIE